MQQNNVQLEKQQNELKSHIEQMVQSEQLLQRDVRKYDEAPEWQLPEPGAFASAKSFRDKVVMLKDMSDRTELLQEKADDLECVKKYVGAEQIDTTIRKVKEQERTEQQIRQYDRPYGTR